MNLSFLLVLKSSFGLSHWQKYKLLSSENELQIGASLIKRYKHLSKRQDLPWRKSSVATFDLKVEPFFLTLFEDVCTAFLSEENITMPHNIYLNDAQLCSYIKPGDGFDTHKDLENDRHGRFRRLTLVLLLSNSFQGCEFLANGVDVKLKIGEAIVFDAAKVEHEVKPLISGERFSLVLGLFWRVDPWLLLLDRDGVLNQDVGRPGVLRAEQFKPFPAVEKQVKRWIQAGHYAAIVTNQKAVDRGLLSRKELDDIHQVWIDTSFGGKQHSPFLDIYVATKEPFLKPSPHLILRAIKATQSFTDNIGLRTILIGDSDTDLESAFHSGLDCALLVTSSHHGQSCFARTHPTQEKVGQKFSIQQQPRIHSAAVLTNALARDHRTLASNLVFQAEEKSIPVTAVFPDAAIAIQTCLEHVPHVWHGCASCVFCTQYVQKCISIGR